MVDRAVTFLEENNVADDFCSCVCFERSVRQTDSTQQISTFGNVLAGRRIFAVQRVATGDECHDAARTHLVDGLSEKVVVDAETKFVISLVVYPVLAKGNITHSKIIEVAAVSSFKSGNFNAGFRVELLRNAACDAVQFHTIQAAVLHGVWQHPEEVAHAHARLQNVTAAETHALHCIVDGMDHGRVGVVGV